MWMRVKTMGEKVVLLNNAGMISSVHEHETNGNLIKFTHIFLCSVLNGLCYSQCIGSSHVLPSLSSVNKK